MRSRFLFPASITGADVRRAADGETLAISDWRSTRGLGRRRGSANPSQRDDWPVDASKNVLDLFLHAHKIKP
jgi:hypothetical protein